MDQSQLERPGPSPLLILGAAGDLARTRLWPALAATQAIPDLLIPCDTGPAPPRPEGCPETFWDVVSRRWREIDATDPGALRHAMPDRGPATAYIALPPLLHEAAVVAALSVEQLQTVYLEKGLPRATTIRSLYGAAVEAGVDLWPVDHYALYPATAAAREWWRSSGGERRVRMQLLEGRAIPAERAEAIPFGVGPDLLIHLLTAARVAFGDLRSFRLQASPTVLREEVAPVSGATYLRLTLANAQTGDAIELETGFYARRTVKRISAEAPQAFEASFLGEDPYREIMRRVVSRRPIFGRSRAVHVAVLRVLERILMSFDGTGGPGFPARAHERVS